jgi:hypothetical protein
MCLCEHHFLFHTIVQRRAHGIPASRSGVQIAATPQEPRWGNLLGIQRSHTSQLHKLYREKKSDSGWRPFLSRAGNSDLQPLKVR